MIYRSLGPTGIKVSVIGYGNWVNSNSKEAQQLTNDCVKSAWDLGINYFDTAEAYGKLVYIQDLDRLRHRLARLSKHSTFPDTILSSQPRSSGEPRINIQP